GRRRTGSAARRRPCVERLGRPRCRPVSAPSTSPAAASPAATVILVRERPASGLEVLLVQRAAQLSFHGGAWVFPGGRVEGAELALGDELGAARLAARRETFEEAG